MTDQPPEKKKRTVKKRPRRIPNAAPGLEGASIPDQPRQAAPIGDGITVDARGVSVDTAYVPPSALLIGDPLAEDLEGLTPRQRKWWKAAAGAHARRGRHRITDEHKAKFLAALTRFPDIAGAAAESGFSVRAWIYLRARDPEFGKAVEDALQAGLPVIERAMSIRGFQGTLEPIVQNGQVVAYRRVYSDRAMEMRARKLDPQGYSEKLMVAGQVNGTVRHVHELSPSLQSLAEKMLGIGPVIEAKAVEAGPPGAIAGIASEMLGRQIEARKAQDVVPSAPDNEAESVEGVKPLK